MADPIHHFLTIQNRAGECLEPPPDPAHDPCKITVEEASTGGNFVLERKGSSFQVVTADAAKIHKTFPGYNVPARMIADYLLVQGEFFKALGDEKNPTDLMKKINLGTESSAQTRAIAQWTNVLSNFVALGQLDPKDPKMKELQANAIRIAFYTFTDPTLGVTVEKTLKKLQENARLTPESRTRIEWLLQISSAREKFWSLLKPKMDKSAQLDKELKARSVNLFIFLFANHLLAEKGYNPYLFAGEMKDTAKAYHEILSKVEPDYDASKNFYAFIAQAMKEMQNFELKPEYQKDFQLRASFIQAQYEKTAKQEMIDILAAQDEEKSFREYLKIKYGDTPERAAALEIILRHMRVKVEKDKTIYTFNMEKIDQELRTWAGAKFGPEHQKALAAALYLLKALFERGEKMEVFLEQKIQKVDTFYESGNFALLGSNKKALEDLIVWARSSAKVVDLNIRPEEKPHIALRKWTLGVELGVGLAGVGTAAALFAADKNSPGRHYGQGVGFALGAAGLCAAGGNLLAHKLDKNGKAWLFDLGGALICGSVAATVYGLTVKPPRPGGGDPMTNPGHRNPVDDYGP